MGLHPNQQSGDSVLAVIDRMGQQVAFHVSYIIELFFLTYLSMRTAVVGNKQGWRTLYSVISAQIYFTGWQAMPLIVFLALGSGALVALQSLMQMTYLGGVGSVGKMILVVIVREVGPLLTALIVIARSGTAVASELGSMQVNKEIDALKAMGINPLSYVIFPRLLGGVVSVLCLSFYFAVFAALSGSLVALWVKRMPWDVFFTSLAQAATLSDLFVFFIKSFMSGVIIFSVSCSQGLKVQKSPHEIPQVTTQAVVKSTVYVLAFHFIMTASVYAHYIVQMGLL